ncbi:ABC transporter permease, partial [Actinomadura adrarensis]
QGGDCAGFLRTFAERRQAAFLGVSTLMLVLPGQIGLFWGAPMIARELEAGTHRLVWNQAVTRARWLAVKLALTGLFAMAVTGLTSLVVSWWAGPLDKAAAVNFPVFQKSAPLLFAVRGVVPIGYAAFAFVLGVTIGMLIRRTLPAMAVTLAVFAAVQLGMPTFVRPHLREPVQVSAPLSNLALDGL